MFLVYLEEEQVNMSAIYRKELISQRHNEAIKFAIKEGKELEF